MVCQVEIALFIDVADVAKRCPSSQVGDLSGFVWTVVVLKLQTVLEVDLACLPDGKFLAIFVTGMNGAYFSPANGTLVRQPFGRIEANEAVIFRVSVVFDDDITPPCDHLMLHIGRTGCGGGDSHGH